MDESISRLAPVILFLLLGSSVIFLLDAMFGWGFVRQALARQYPKTEGVVTSCQAVQSSMEGATKPEICYSYSVDGRQFHGDRFRYCEGASNGARPWNVLERFPVGKQVAVFYNPLDPADALLDKELSGIDLVIGLFFILFNTIFVSGWCLLAFSRWRVRKYAQTGGIRVTFDGTCWSADLTRLWALTGIGGFVIGLTLASFGALFFVWGFLGTDPDFDSMLRVHETVLGIAFAAGAIAWLLSAGSVRCLLLDNATGMVTLPARFPSRNRRTVSRQQILGVEVSHFKTDASQVKLVIQNSPGEAEHQLIGRWNLQAMAEAFADWLILVQGLPRYEP